MVALLSFGSLVTSPTIDRQSGLRLGAGNSAEAINLHAPTAARLAGAKRFLVYDLVRVLFVVGAQDARITGRTPGFPDVAARFRRGPLDGHTIAFPDKCIYDAPLEFAVLAEIIQYLISAVLKDLAIAGSLIYRCMACRIPHAEFGAG